MLSVAIVGSGPTALYTLAGLTGAPGPLYIVIFERDEISGTGGPYRPGDTDRLLLANIGSIEIPPIETSFADWLRAMPDNRLALFGVVPGDIGERSFLPRVLLGAYLRDQMRLTVERAGAAGHRVKVYADTRVVDIAATPEGCNISALHDASLFSVTADHVVLATGHHWPEDDVGAQRFASPWPSAKLTGLGLGHIGILGTSLSGIDAAIAVASGCGAFVEREGGVVYEPNDGQEALRLTLMSRKGLLPEADFYCPIPYEPLQVCTPEALAKAARGPDEGRLNRVFSLIRQEIAQADPDYVEAIGLADLDADSFRNAYFAERLAADPFDYAARNLAAVERDAKARRTSGYRYAILRLHEAVEPLVAGLSGTDRARFADGIAQVFIDNYAAVPPQTIARLLALHEAGALEVLRLGEGYDCVTEGVAQGAIFHVGDTEVRLDVLIDARGQSAQVLGDLAFPALRRQLLQEPMDAERPLDLTADLALRMPTGAAGVVYCAAVPFLMHRMPFVQGLTACHWLGKTVSRALCDGFRRKAEVRPATAA